MPKEYMHAALYSFVPQILTSTIYHQHIIGLLKIPKQEGSSRTFYPSKICWNVWITVQASAILFPDWNNWMNVLSKPIIVCKTVPRLWIFLRIISYHSCYTNVPPEFPGIIDYRGITSCNCLWCQKKTLNICILFRSTLKTKWTLLPQPRPFLFIEAVSLNVWINWPIYCRIIFLIRKQNFITDSGLS